jgi:hypothetical protein
VDRDDGGDDDVGLIVLACDGQIHAFGGPTMLLREFLVLIKSPTKRYRAALTTTQYDIAIDVRACALSLGALH